MTSEPVPDALTRLRHLRDVGAISEDDFRRISGALARPVTPSAAMSGGVIQSLGTIAAGVIVGNLAADMLTQAFADEPTPQAWEYESVTETTYTEDGTIVETQESFQPVDDADYAAGDFSSGLEF